MKSLGRKQGHPMAAETTKEESMSFPSTSIDHSVMPHLKKHNVGDTGHMKIKYKVTGQNQYRSGEGHTSLDITHAEHSKEEGAKHEAKESAAKEKKEEGK